MISTPFSCSKRCNLEGSSKEIQTNIEDNRCDGFLSSITGHLCNNRDDASLPSTYIIGFHNRVQRKHCCIADA